MAPWTRLVSKSVFQQSALSTGLVTQDELDEALRAARADTGSSDRSVSDDRLALKMEELGMLNRWQAEQLKAGRTKFNLGSYHFIDSIGHGGMGEVYKAEHAVMGRVVAVKILPRHKATPDTVASFMREIRTQAQLDHENLVRAYDAGQDGNVHFMVTEYVPGTDLRRLIRKQGRLDALQGASIISQAARGLGHAHSFGLIHRDVKPGNILVTPEGRAKVSDLGLSGYFHDAEQTDSKGGKVVGTADYLAPEQISTPDKLTPASDIYALGCTLYYAVTGKVPFPGGTAREKARAHLTLAPLDPRRLNPNLEDEFVDLIADMMAKRPEDRIQTAEQVIARIAPWASELVPTQGGGVEAVAPPPITPPPVRRALVQGASGGAGGAEGLPFLVQPTFDPTQLESPSQVSLGTSPFLSASQETLPIFPDISAHPSYPRGYRLGGKRSTNVWGIVIGVAVIAGAAWAIYLALS